MNIKLLHHTENMNRLIATAARVCYSDKTIDEILSIGGYDKMVDKIVSMGHESVLEHATFTFSLEGVSRAALSQITRHRIASYSVRSQRYTTMNSDDLFIPEEIQECKEALDIFNNISEKEFTAYNDITDILYKRYTDEGMNDKAAHKKAIENARYILPNACTTTMVMTINARSLMNFFKHRLCNRAQRELVLIATEMFKLAYSVSPSIFKNALPSCSYGACSEGAMSCGNRVSLDSIIGGDRVE